MARMLDGIQLLGGNSQVLDHPSLCVLSAAYHKLASAREELEENSKVARRIIQSIFTDGGEEQHDVRRDQGVLVFSLSEAIVDEVPTCRSPANTIHLQSPSRKRDDVPTPTTVIDTLTIVTDSASVDRIDKPSTSIG
ncbi:hypothetical protein JOM56_000921 [Amanita muscaria]